MSMPTHLKLCVIARYVAIFVCMTLPTISCKTPSSPPVDDADGASEVSDTIFEAAPSPAASDAAAHDPFVAACANLANLGCPEGQKPNCPATLKHVVDSNLTPIDVGCLITASSVVEARGCGATITCGATK